MKWLLLSLMICALVFNSNADSDGNEREQEVDHSEDHDQKAHHTWCYNLDHGETGPDKWGELFPGQCGKMRKRQSPINIKMYDAKLDEHLEDIDLREPDEDDTNKRMYLFNNGHSAKLEIENAELYIDGGSLGSLFKVAQLHFHWGSDGEQGSEHTINGKQFPLEMHVVTYDAERYSNLGDAVTGDNSLAVFGTFYALENADNKNLDHIVDRLKDVTQPGKEHKQQIPWFSIGKIMAPVTRKYFRYEGSLTTPSCDQSVVWTVFATPSYVSEKQLAEFRKLVEGVDADGNTVQLVNNWRPTQPLHEREIKKSFVSDKKQIDKKKEKYQQAAGTDNGASTLKLFTFVPTIFLCLVFSHYTKH